MPLAKRYAGIQDKLKKIGTDGCHFLTLCSIAEEYLQDFGSPSLKVDLIDAVNLALEKRLIDTEYEVKSNCGLLEALTGACWSQETVSELPVKIDDNQYTEVVYKNPRTNFKHYRRRSVDTLENSVTVAEGYILEYRLYTVIR